MKSHLIIILLCVLPLSGFAQNRVSGTVVDEENRPLQSATVVLLNPADSTMEYFSVCNKDGEYSITNIDKGKYLIQYAFVGMESVFVDIEIPLMDGENLGTTVMKVKPVGVETVMVEGEYVPMKFKSDTVEFNAKAFNTKPDAVVEELLKKLPGIEIDRAGNIKAMGEDVRKVLVDGKEFFGDDPKVATKNLPADAIDKVQIYDRRSDVSQFTGIDDGVRDRTIDLQLQEDKKTGIFGNILAGYGTGNHYQAGGRAFRFNEVSQIALLGNFNNINRFGVKDVEWGKDVNGLNTSGAAGLNLSYNPRKWNRYYMSYMANGTRSVVEQETKVQNFLQDFEYFETNTLDQTTRDTSHNFHLGVRSRVLSWQNLVADANINISERNLVRHNLMNRLTDDLPVNRLLNGMNEEANSLDYSGNATYIMKVNGDNTQITTRVNASGSRSFEESGWDNTTTYFKPDRISTDSQFQENHRESLNASVVPALVQRIGRFWFIESHVALGLNNNSLDRDQGFSGAFDDLVDSLSPKFNREYQFLRPGISFQRNTQKNQLNLTLGAEWSKMEQILWDDRIRESNYFYLKPRISYNSQYKSGRRFGANYGTGLNLPGIARLMPVVTRYNQLSSYRGNSSLEPEFRHSAGLEWRVFDQFSFTSFFASLSGNYTKNKIGVSRTINEDLEQTASPVNVPWGYGANAHMSFSTPIRPLDIVISLGINESYNRGINIINAEDNIGTHLNHSFSFDLNNRNKNTWDGEVGASVSMTDSRYSIQEDLNNRYFNFSYFGYLRWTPSERFNIQVDADVTNYNSQSFNESISIPLIGAEMNVYFLSGNRLVLTLEAADLLNKNTGLLRISDVHYLMQQTTNMLGRYAMLSVKYRLTRMGGKL